MLSTFVYDVPGYESLVWNVDVAQAQIAAGAIEATILMPLDVMADLVTRNYVDPAHVARVDFTQPGIGAPIINPQPPPDGIIYVLIDGTHRCAKALAAGQPFRVHLLTDAAAKAALVRGPAALMPFDWP